MKKQLSLFEFNFDDSVYKINDLVRVKAANKEKLANDIESYFYIKEYENKEGKIVEIIENLNTKQNFQYCVVIEGIKAYFYHTELEKIKNRPSRTENATFILP